MSIVQISYLLEISMPWKVVMFCLRSFHKPCQIVPIKEKSHHYFCRSGTTLCTRQVLAYCQVVFEALQPKPKHSFPFDCFRTLQTPSCPSSLCPHLTFPQTFCTSPILGFPPSTSTFPHPELVLSAPLCPESPRDLWTLTR